MRKALAHLINIKGIIFLGGSMQNSQQFASIYASFHNLFNSQRSLSKRSAFNLNSDAALYDGRALMILQNVFLCDLLCIGWLSGSTWCDRNLIRIDFLVIIKEASRRKEL